MTAAERTKHGALAAAGFIPFVGWGGRAFKGGKAIHSTYKGMKATDSALNAYQTGRTLDNLRKAEYGLYGITSANGLGEYVTGKDMFGNELSEEQRERSLNEALAFLGGNVTSVGLRKASPTVNLGQVNKSDVKLDRDFAKAYLRDIELKTNRKVPKKQIELIKESLRNNKFEKLTPKETAKHRGKFRKSVKDRLIEQWEDKTAQEWPRYTEPVLKKNGKISRKVGQPYDAHHIIETNYGGPHEWWNIHPAKYPNEHQAGIHGKGAPSRKLFPRR